MIYVWCGYNFLVDVGEFWVSNDRAEKQRTSVFVGLEFGRKHSGANLSVGVRHWCR